MIEALHKIVEFFSMLWDFVVMLVKGIGMLFSVIPKGLAFLMGTVPYIPSLVAPFVIITITISIVYFILGRRVE